MHPHEDIPSLSNIFLGAHSADVILFLVGAILFLGAAFYEKVKR